MIEYEDHERMYPGGPRHDHDWSVTRYTVHLLDGPAAKQKFKVPGEPPLDWYVPIPVTASASFISDVTPLLPPTNRWHYVRNAEPWPFVDEEERFIWSYTYVGDA